jgi:hypothetical protein
MFIVAALFQKVMRDLTIVLAQGCLPPPRADPRPAQQDNPGYGLRMQLFRRAATVQRGSFFARGMTITTTR